MIEIWYIDGEKEIAETDNGNIIFNLRTSCFEVEALRGKIIIPKDFVKSIREIK